MKTTWPILLGLLLLAAPAAVQAQLYYATNNGAITLTEYNGAGGAVVIPNFVTSIGDYAFYGCEYLESVTIPGSVTNIGEGAFQGCPGLTAITVDFNNSFYNDVNGVLFNESQSTLVQYPAGLVGIYAIPNSVTNVWDYAFFGCTRLTGVKIPASVTSIGDDAFYACSSLTSVTIPGSVTRIGDDAFNRCPELTNITISNGVTSIGAYAFSGYYGIDGYAGDPLTSVTIPNSVTSIGDYAFYYCTGLTNVTIGASVASIREGAFEYCTGLTTVTIPGSVTSIGGDSFYGCSGLTAITVDPNNAFYGDVDGILFNASQATLIQYPPGLVGAYRIPDGVTSIETNAFEDCTYLTSVSLPGSVTNIGSEAFAGCIGLTGVTLEDGVTSIGDYSFQSCSGLTSVTIPNSVTSIGTSAFVSCSRLASITIGSGVTDMQWITFSEYDLLTAITVDAQNLFYSSINGVLFDKSQTTLIQYPSGLVGSYTIPGSVASIGDDAFKYCSRLTNITIPNSVTNIGAYAFYGCGLTNITIPDGVISIGAWAFADCQLGDGSITIPSSVTSIGTRAFLVSSVYAAIPNGVYFQGNLPSLGDYLFRVYPYRSPPFYYLPGATGWSSSSGVLWNPLIQVGDGNFGVQNHQFGFNITGTNNFTVVVAACTNLAGAVWVPLTTNTLVNGSFHFNDPQWTNYPNRYYSLQMP
jgi:hypothetical protein